MPSFTSADHESYLRAYEERLRFHRERVSGERGHNTFCLNTISNAECSIDNETLNFFCEEVRNNKDNCDFKLISLIRGLYINDRHPNRNVPVESKILESLSQCAFWPCSIQPEQYRLLDKMCFWSENHILMILSSYHLYNQYLDIQDDSAMKSVRLPSAQRIAADHKNSPEFKLLQRYLQVHVQMGGMYEALSHVYLPYSISALLNLIDFSGDQQLVADATAVMDVIIGHLLLTSPQSGAGATFTASARAFLRTRTRSTGHNVNQLFRLLLGDGPDDYNASAVCDFMLTTGYRPSEAAVGLGLGFCGFKRLRMSHEIHEIRELYSAGLEIDEAELVPFYWSAGLITHSDFIGLSRKYQKQKNMHHNNTLWILRYSGVHSIMTSYPHFSAGQVYTGIDLNVYKNGGVVMTSFEDFNNRCVSFSQLPWCVNIDGLPVWSQSGKGSESIADFSIINTHSPCVRQRHNILVVTYVTPGLLKNTIVVGSIFHHMVRFFWPRAFFDEEVTSKSATTRFKGVFKSGSEQVWDGGVWWCGRRARYYVGAMCTKDTYEDASDCKDARLELFGRKDIAVRRKCSDHYHSWVVVVGTADEHSSLTSFMESLVSGVSYQEQKEGRRYRVSVAAPGVLAEDIVIEASA